ncbi:16321_t:CDS:2 [Acaulospora morrowiae]|uniref:16321_t:CDS:1 n=1 Tax=Acaulospora morrowiae TaxID=94023 RepID=A0A9N9C539_9GLOM|nr:16321_t:CDS:2 [Acaulospora morrowiae]
MSRSSWWSSTTYNEYDFLVAPKSNPTESSKNSAKEKSSPVSEASNTSEACSRKIQDKDAPNTIPIPQNQNSGYKRGRVEQRSKTSSWSWWSSSSSGRSHMNSSSPEEKHKYHDDASTYDSDKDSNSSSVDISSSISETHSENKKSHQSVEINPIDSAEKEHKKPSETATIIENSEEHTVVNKASDPRSSSSWWLFGNNNNNSRSSEKFDTTKTTINTNTVIDNKSTTDLSQIKVVTKDSSITQQNEEPDQSKNPIKSSTTSIQNGYSTVRVKKTSSDTKRWSLFGTWSSSTSTLNLLENNDRSENNKTDDEASSTEPDAPLSRSSTLPTTLPPSNITPSPSAKDSQKSSTNPQNKHEANPLVQSLSKNKQSWLDFFTNGPPSQTNVARIKKNSSIKMITDGKPDDTLPVINEVPKSMNTFDEGKAKPVVIKSSPKLKPVPLNVVLPTFDEFAINKPRKIPNSPIQQTLHIINSYFFPPDKPLEGGLPKWLDEITRSTVDVKRIAIIGVHGWYPTKFVRSVVGEPTGTSQKFCDMMAKAVLGYLSQHNISLPSDAITCIPLVGEGTIEARVKLLYENLMHNKTWCEALSLADVVFVATHSQGTPVSTILLSRLINERLVNPRRQRICMLAMAGISHGPFPYLLKNYLITYYIGTSDPSKELFEFMNPESMISKKYHEALKTVINCDVKIVYAASLDDQVVPLYSGLFTGLSHPSIMRAIYIDGPLYQENDFLTNLIVFCIRLRNAGILDHGLIVQLSEVAAGPIYGEGHSSLYTEIDVYTLAVRYLFETAPLGRHEIKIDKFQAQHKNNPSYLPWAMRGILEDKNVTRSRGLVHEINILRKQYKEWEPTTKIMKDIKLRLEPFKDIILERARL